MVGTAGADLHKFTGQALFVVKQYRVWAFLEVNLTGNAREMRVTFYDIDGASKDQFAIRK